MYQQNGIQQCSGVNMSSVLVVGLNVEVVAMPQASSVIRWGLGRSFPLPISLEGLRGHHNLSSSSGTLGRK